MTTIRELIDTLQALADEHGEDIEVRLAQQPNWPFEYHVGNVVAVDLNDTSEEVNELQRDLRDPHGLTPDDRAAIEERLAAIDDEAPEVVVYIGEAGQMGYLPDAATNELGWGR